MAGLPFSLPASLSTLLDAVNACLFSIGEAPVSDILANEAVDVNTAIGIINAIDLSVQSVGWSWNRETSLLLNPDASKFIQLPGLTLRVSNAYWASTGSIARVVQRGTRLYNTEDHTFEFTDGIEVDMLTRMDFDQLPEPARRYITALSVDRFQATQQNNSGVKRVTEQDIVLAKAALEQHEDEVARTNGVNCNKSVLSALYGQGGLRRLRRGQ
jgi:hypothetical protein